MSTDVLLLYEHKVREIPTMYMIYHELSKRGYKVKLQNCYKERPHFRYILWDRPRLVVTPQLYSQGLMERIHLKFIYGTDKILNMQWEQVYEKHYDEISDLAPSGLAKEATHICWGEKSFHRLKNAGVKNAVLTGPPQMDYLKPAYDELHIKNSILRKKLKLPTPKRCVEP